MTAAEKICVLRDDLVFCEKSDDESPVTILGDDADTKANLYNICMHTIEVLEVIKLPFFKILSFTLCLMYRSVFVVT